MTSIIHTFTHEGKQLYVTDDLKVTDTKPIEPLAPGEYELDRVADRLKEGDEIWLKAKAEGGCTVGFYAADGTGGKYSCSRSLHGSTRIYIGKPQSLQPESAEVYVHQLTEADIGKRFEIVKGADAFDRDQAGKIMPLVRLGNGAQLNRWAFFDNRGNTSWGLHRNTLLRRLL